MTRNNTTNLKERILQSNIQRIRKKAHKIIGLITYSLAQKKLKIIL
jgi:hypothetical protein